MSKSEPLPTHGRSDGAAGASGLAPDFTSGTPDFAAGTPDFARSEAGTEQPPAAAAKRWVDLGRILSHLAVIIAFGAAVIRALNSGWRAVSDDGVIALRAWNVFSANSPLVGQHTQLVSSGTTSIYDLGPLQYWLLVVPLHLDPNHGALWGSALCCVLAGMLAIEAARAAIGRAAGVVTALAVVWAAGWMPDVALNPVWNPYLGTIFFIASLASALAVFNGKHRWWPVAVFTGSVAIQSHLMFVLASGLVVMTSGCVMAYRLRRDKRLALETSPVPLLVGLVVVAFCWLAPLIQQIRYSPGNLALLISSQSSQSRMGIDFGLRSLAASTAPTPIWLHPETNVSVLSYLNHGHAIVGIAVIAVVAIIGLVAAAQQVWPLCALAAMSIMCSLSLVATFANVTASKVLTIWYLAALSMPTGVLTLVVIGWAALLAYRQLPAESTVRRVRTPAAAIDERSGGAVEVGAVEVGAVEVGAVEVGPAKAVTVLSRPRPGWVIASIVSLVALSLVAQSNQLATADNLETPLAIRETQMAARLIEAKVPRTEPITVLVFSPGTQNDLDDYGVTTGVTWQLAQNGWTPVVPNYIVPVVGPGYTTQSPTEQAVILISHNSVHLIVLQPGQRF